MKLSQKSKDKFIDRWLDDERINTERLLRFVMAVAEIDRPFWMPGCLDTCLRNWTVEECISRHQANRLTDDLKAARERAPA